MSACKHLDTYVCKLIMFSTFVCVCIVGTVFAVPHHESRRSIDTSFYYDYSHLTAFLQNMTQTYPGITKLHSIGKSVQNRDLWALEITDNVETTEVGEPKFKYVGNMHGNEVIGRQILIYLIQHLLENYNKDGQDRITRLVNEVDIFIMPTMNPDGFESASEGICGGVQGRENANNVDLNRNFPDQFDPNSGHNIQPETQALIDWIEGTNFVLSANLHGGSLVASYPWDDSLGHQSTGFYSAAPDDKVFKQLAHTYSNNHLTMHRNGQRCGDSFEAGITNGDHWYDVPGGMQDYNYLFSNCLEITIELSCCKYPVASELHQEWDNNREALLAYMEQIFIGVSGQVIDSGTQQGIAGAHVIVQGIAHNITTDEHGYFWRLLVPGSYRLSVHADGYSLFESGNIVVPDSGGAEVKWEMKKIADSSQGIQITDYTLDVLVSQVNRLRESRHRDNLQFEEPAMFKHHNQQDLEAMLRTLTQEYPQITRLYSIGQSVEGRELWVVEISDNPGKHEPGEPEFKYIGNMHGNEVVGREMLLLLIELLCKNYGKNAFLTGMVNHTRIHIMPTMNPDGYMRSREGDIYSVAGRGNAHMVDLNRNFPHRLDGGSSTPEKETVLVMKWLHQYPFVLSANLHGGSLVANYPFDDGPQDHEGFSKSADEATFIQLTKAYSLAHSTMYLGHPCPNISSDSFTDGITNGAKWYTVSGGMQDYNYVNTNCFEITIELGCFKFPYAADLNEYWTANEYPLLVFMGQVHKGVRGFVLDGETKAPLANATISVQEIDHVIKSAADGDYWRLLAPGTYTLTVSSPGYIDQTLAVHVSFDAATEVNFTLKRSPADSWSKANDFSIKENMGKKYLSNQGIHEELRKLATLNTDIMEYKIIQKTKEGWSIPLVHLSKNLTNHEEKKPHVLLIGSLHGDDPVTGEMLMRFIRHVLQGYLQKNADILRLLADVHLHIIPQLDVNGVAHAVTGDCSGAKNTGTSEFHSLSLEDPKLSGLQKEFESHRFNLVVSLSAGGQYIVIPWENPMDGLRQTDDEDVLMALGRSFADALPSMYKSDTCSTDLPNGLVHGADLKGDSNAIMMDEVYTKYHSLMLSVHMSCCKYPSGDQLPDLWMSTLEPLTNMVKKSMQGVYGRVLNAKQEALSDVEVKIDHHVHSHPTSKNGEFFFIMTEGPHIIEFSAQGYQTLTNNVLIQRDQTSTLDVVLAPEVSSLQHHKYTDLQTFLSNATKACQNKAQVLSIGKTSQGLDIWRVELGPENGDARYVPEALFVGGLHGDEPVGYEMLLQMVAHLCDNYKKDYIVTSILDSIRIHVIPSLNPDGLMKAQQGNCGGGAGHTNVNAVDLDTTFLAPDVNGSKSSEKETSSLLDWLKVTFNPSITVVMRAGDMMVLYPHQSKTAPLGRVDKASLVNLGLAYVDNHPVMGLRQFRCNSSKGTQTMTQEMGIMEASTVKDYKGSLMDYVYDQLHSAVISVYVSCCRYPAESELLNLWHLNRKPLLSLAQQARRGLKGVVLSVGRQYMANATLHIEGSQHFHPTDEGGRFWIYLAPGEYTVTVSSHGFKSQEQHVVIQRNQESTELIVYLDRESSQSTHTSLLLTLGVGIIVLVLVVVVTVLMCLRNRKTTPYSNVGFRRVNVGDSDSEDEVYGDLGRNRKEVFGKKKFSAKEFHDFSDTDEDNGDDTNKLFDRQMV